MKADKSSRAVRGCGTDGAEVVSNSDGRKAQRGPEGLGGLESGCVVVGTAGVVC